MFGKTKLERLEEGKKKMKEAESRFINLGENAWALKCRGFLRWWEAQGIWEAAHKRGGEDEIALRSNAISKLHEPEVIFRECRDKKLEKRVIKDREKWLGIIACHQLNYTEARPHFEKGLALCKEVESWSVPWFKAALAECEAWQLVYDRWVVFRPVSYENLASKFRQVEEDYHNADDDYSASYLRGWRSLFEFLANPSFENLNLYKTFRDTICLETTYIESGAKRKKLKFGITLFAGELSSAIEKETKPYFLYVKCHEMARDLESFLLNKRRELNELDSRFQLTKSSLSLEMSVGIFEAFGAKPPEMVRWLVDYNHRCKHGEDAKKELPALIKEASLKELIILDELPNTLRQYKQQVENTIKQILSAK
jgi:hypothetical protein